MAAAATTPTQSHATTPTGPTPSNQRKGPGLIATNTVTTKDGLTVRARIDPTLVRAGSGDRLPHLIIMAYSLLQT
jgi:hypothetical protein